MFKIKFCFVLLIFVFFSSCSKEVIEKSIIKETLLTLEDTGGSGAHSQITLKNTTGTVASLLTTSDNLEFRVDDATVFANISGTEHMRIKSSGLVGIGTSAPEVALSVVGLDTQIHFSEAPDSGGYLMSEAAGQFGISGGAGNTPPVSPAQGNAGGAGGGTSPDRGAGGGGGAGGSGTASPNSTTAGSGGAGVTTSITNSPVTRAGGGGANIYHPSATNPGPGGSGGASNGGGNSSSCNATVNTGSGSGGGANNPASSGNGGSGIVVIRYKFQ